MMKVRENELKLTMEEIVDFESFNVNGYPLKEYFEVQGWMPYFEMLNGPIYPYLVNNFLVREKKMDEDSASFEERQKIAEDEANKGNNIVEIGLKEFKEVEIRSVVMGVEVTITQSHIAHLFGVFVKGRFTLNIKESSKEANLIKSSLFLNSDDFGKVKNMKIPYSLLFKILIGYLIPREGSTGQISWDHMHLIWYLVNGERINLDAYIFNKICEAIRERYKHKNKNVSYARLLFELFHQIRLIKYLKETSTTQDLEESYGNIMSASIQGHMKIIKKKDVVKPEASLSIKSGKIAYIKDFPVISNLDNTQMIQEYINIAKEQASIILTMDDIQDAPENV